MSLQNRKGLALPFFIDFILLIFGAVLIIQFINVKFAQADEKTAENLCWGFNAIRFATRQEAPGGVKFNIAPRACKTINKNELPGKDYKENVGGVKEGAKKEIKDLMMKCWWMWLEGSQPNILDSSTTSFTNKCFVCYTFSLKDGINIPITEFLASLNEPYYAIDTSDRCAPGGQGGHCRAACDKSSEFSREVPSTRCKSGEKCCVDENIGNECLNKKGRCNNPEEGYLPYDKWKCKDGTCYINKDNFASYLDYIQGTKGAGLGSGYLAYQTGLEKFNSGKQYGIVLVSPGNSWSWDTLGSATTTVVLGGLSLAAFKIPLISLPLAGGTIYMGKLTTQSGIPNMNFLYLSEYESVKDKCAIEATSESFSGGGGGSGGGGASGSN